MLPEMLLKRLRTLEFLRGLDEETLTSIADQAVWKVFPENAVVFWEGDTEVNLYFLQYGSLKVVKSGLDGRQQTLRFLTEGEIFNEIGVFGRRPNPATAIALEESGIWYIPRPALEHVLMTNPQTSLQIMENLADRFSDLVQLTADLSLRPVEARFAKLLLETCEGEAIPRRRWTTQVELAARLGTVPDVLSRIEREFTRAGLIVIDKQHIRILDRPGLIARARVEE